MRKEDTVWMHYVKSIIAADVPSAVFLANYMKRLEDPINYAPSFEVFDLQKINVFRKPSKVIWAIKKRADLPFVFFVGKN